MISAMEKAMHWMGALLVVAFVSITLVPGVAAQDQDQNQGQYQNQDQNQNPDQDDPPSRVARLGYMEGSVSFQPAGESEWVSAVPNRPMTTGDKLWTDQNSRVEVQLGSAVIRIAANTSMSFLNLDDRTVQMQLLPALSISVYGDWVARRISRSIRPTWHSLPLSLAATAWTPATTETSPS